MAAGAALASLPTPCTTVNASLLESANADLIDRLATADDIDLSFTDLSSGTDAEREAQTICDRIARMEGEVIRAEKEYNTAHLEKEFEKIAQKKKNSKGRKEQALMEIDQMGTRMRQLNETMEHALWKRLQAAWEGAGRGPKRVVFKNCGLSPFILLKLLPSLSIEATEVILDGNDLEDRGAEVCAELLRDAVELQTLSVRDCGFTDGGMGTLAAGIVSAPKIKTLDARDNGLSTRQSAQLAFGALEQFKPGVECLV